MTPSFQRAPKRQNKLGSGKKDVEPFGGVERENKINRNRRVSVVKGVTKDMCLPITRFCKAETKTVEKWTANHRE